MISLRHALFTTALLATAFAAEARSVLFPERIEVDANTVLERQGVSRLTVGFIFDVYEAAFYLPAGTGPGDALSDVPKHLELDYLRSISREDFIKAADDMLTAQHDPVTIQSIQDGINRINQLYQDVRKGDRYSLTYIPGSGTTLMFNGQPRGVIEGAAFARVYFSIWLGEDNPYKSFRDRLVGLR